MLYLEDDDVAAIKDGTLAIHRLKRGDSGRREMVTLKMELEQIMKGTYVPNTHTSIDIREYPLFTN